MVVVVGRIGDERVVALPSILSGQLLTILHEHVVFSRGKGPIIAIVCSWRTMSLVTDPKECNTIRDWQGRNSRSIRENSGATAGTLSAAR